MVFVGIMSCNTSKAIWGEDAHEWKPERWLSPLPESVTKAKIPGVYSNLYVDDHQCIVETLHADGLTHRMTFWGGGRACM